MRFIRLVIQTAGLFAMITALTEARATTNIDVMILYDKASRDYVADNDGNSFLANANLLLANLNLSMSNSTVDVRYRLVHFGCVGTNFSGDISNALFTVGQRTSGLEQVTTWIADLGVDISTMLTAGTDPNGAAGMGFLAPSAGDITTAFNAQNIQQAEDYRTMPHEVGHNMGCGHSIYQRMQPGPGAFSYAAGWYFRGTNYQNYCTMMAYENDGYGYLYEMVYPWYFSNPDLRHMGVPIGDTNYGDNVSCLNNMIPVVAEYMAVPANIPPSIEITSPFSGDEIDKPKLSPYISMNVEAFDPDGTITGVVFYTATDSVLTGIVATSGVITNSLTNQPTVFVGDITNALTGTNWLFAVAWDNGGNCWTSLPVDVVVQTNKYPVFGGNGGGLTQPSNSVSLGSLSWAQHGWLVNFKAAVSDPDGYIDLVEYYVNGGLVASSTNSPFEVNWICPVVSTPPDSSNDVVVVAYDDEGAFLASATNIVFIGPDIPPFVEILTPTNGASQWRTNVTITAAANDYDIDDTITGVVFCVDGTPVGMATNSPYSCSWAAPGIGTNTLTAIAYSSDGECSTSRPSLFYIVANPPPVVTIVSPTNGTVLTGRGISIIADAVDAEDGVTNLSLYVNGTNVASFTRQPYWYTWLSSTNGGDYDLTAVAVDGQGITATSAVVTVTSGTNLPPTVAITSPLNNAVIPTTNTYITLSCTATDPQGTVTSVVFYVNGVLAGRDAVAPYSFSFRNPGVSTNVLSVVAWDNSGNCRYASSSWSVRDTRPDFQVTAITLNPAAPAAGGTFIATVTVTNNGDNTANAGTLSIWTNAPGSQPSGTYATKSLTVGALAGHAGKVLTFTALSAGTVQSTGRTFRAYVDSLRVTAEKNDTNNQATLVYNVTGRPDLAVTAIALSPTIPSRGGVFTANVTVKNQGRAVAADSRMSLWVNQATAVTNDTGETTGQSMGVFAVGQIKVITFTNLSANTGTVARTLRVLADSLNALDDSNRTNNQKYRAYTPKSSPDFVITSVTLSSTNPPVNSTITANVTVKNTGYISGSGGYLDVWANKTTNVVAGSTLRGDKYQLVGTLNTNATRVLTFTGLATGSTVTNRVFRAIVDSRATVQEVLETNNQFTVDYVTQ